MECHITVQTFAVVNASHLGELIVYLEELSVNKHTRNCVKYRKFLLRELVIVGVAIKQLVESFNVKVAKAVYELHMSVELNLIHIEGRSKYLNVSFSIELSRYDKELVFL